MALIADILLWLLIALAALAGLVLIAPVSARAAGEVDAERFTATYDLKIRWALGLLSFGLASGRRPTLYVLGLPVWRFSRDSTTSDHPTKKRTKRAPKTKRKSKKGRGIIWYIRHRQPLWRGLMRLVSTLHIRGRIAGVVGLPEPDDTVWLALAFNQLQRRLPADTCAVAFDYSDGVLDLEGRLSAWVVPLHVLVVGLFLYLFTDLGRAIRGRAAA